jgi:Uma2 family endonuclease
MALPDVLLDPLPLESGDRLSRDEFHRRYEASPHIKKAELIDGVVYVPSPARRMHGGPQAMVMTWLGSYAARHAPDVELLDNATVLLDRESEVQPDAMLRRVSAGSSTVTPDDYIHGPPELIGEVAASSASYDLHTKLQAYERNGVAEYIVWQVYDRKIRWLRLVEGRYEDQVPDGNGFIKSNAFPGLLLNPGHLLEGDLAAAMAALG